MRAMFHGIAILAVGLSAIVACDATAKVRVVATLSTLGAVAKEVGGDRVSVEVLASPGEDPHYVDPRPNLILSLSRADALIVNGLDLEAGWMPPLQAQSRNGKIQTGGPGYLDASAAIQRLGVPTAPVDRAQGDIHPGGNPHFLFDAGSVARVVTAVADLLSRIDPEGTAEYAARGRDVSARLEHVAREAAARVAAMPPEKRRVVSYHRSFPYLYRWLGLEEVATIEPRPGIPPDPAHVARVLATMKATGARVIIQEVFYPRSTSQTLARLTGATLVVLSGGVDLDSGETLERYLQQLIGGVLHAMSH
jgi:zinc/manganese transport system substrate-binding protein